MFHNPQILCLFNVTNHKQTYIEKLNPNRPKPKQSHSPKHCQTVTVTVTANATAANIWLFRSESETFGIKRSNQSSVIRPSLTLWCQMPWGFWQIDSGTASVCCSFARISFNAPSHLDKAGSCFLDCPFMNLSPRHSCNSHHSLTKKKKVPKSPRAPNHQSSPVGVPFGSLVPSPSFTFKFKVPRVISY